LDKRRLSCLMHLHQSNGSTKSVGSCTLVVCIMLFLCVCLLAQMLGMPITLFSLLNASDMLIEPTSEDFSLLPRAPGPGTESRPLFHTELSPNIHRPIFITAVFHPPLSLTR